MPVSEQAPKTAWVAAIAIAAAPGLVAVATAESNPDLAGNWVLDESRSQVERGRAGGPGPQVLVIEVAGENELTIHSDTGMNRAVQTFVFTPGGPEHEIPGPLSWDTTARSDWDGARFVVRITRSIVAPNGQPFNIEMTDVYRVDGDVLTLERTQGQQTWISTFDRTSPGSDD